MGNNTSKKITGAVLVALILVGGIFAWKRFSASESTPTTVPTVTPSDPAPVPESSIESATERRKSDLTIVSTEKTPGEDSKNPVIKQGKDELEQLKFREARVTFQKLAGTNTVAEYYLGVLAAYFGERDAAIPHFQSVISRADEPEATRLSQRFLDAYAVYDTYRDGPPIFLDTLLSKELLAARELELAIEKLRFITSQDKSYTDAWILLGSAYLVRGNNEDALESLKNSLPSDKPEAYYWLGITYIYQNNPQKALAAFKQAQDRGYPDAYKIYEKMGDSYVLLRQYRSAAQSYEKAIELSPALPHLYVRPVWIYIELLNQPDDALVLAKKARDTFTDSALTHNLLGWSYLAIQDYARAKISLEQAKRLDPELPAVYLNLGKYHEATGNAEEALNNYEKAVQLDPEGSIGTTAQDRYMRLSESN